MALPETVAHIANSFCGQDDGRSIAVFADHLADVPIGANACVPRPAASVMKVAIVMSLFDLAADGQLDLMESVPVSLLGQTRYCSILKAFDADHILRLREVAALSLITSDNPAMVYLMSRLTFDNIANVLRSAGCGEQAVCRAGFSETELGPANRVNQFTAEDAIRLFRYLGTEMHYAPIITFLQNNLRNVRIPALLPEDALIAHKTGSLEGVVNDAGIVSRDGRSFIVAFLSDRQADPVATQTDMAMCALKLFEVLISDDGL